VVQAGVGVAGGDVKTYVSLFAGAFTLTRVGLGCSRIGPAGRGKWGRESTPSLTRTAKCRMAGGYLCGERTIVYIFVCRRGWL
jgi:hypothetical protein